jgi:hypothetical protein
MDFEKAFDRVSRNIVFEIIQSDQVQNQLISST